MVKKTDTTASVLAEIAAYGEFLPGSVRKTTEKRKSAKTGKTKFYDAQPIYTYTDPASGKQKTKRIPKAAFARVKELTERYRGLKKLLRRFEAAAVAENLDPDSKKKLLALSVGIRCANIARVIDEFRARPKEASAADLDERIVAAFRADAREQLSEMAAQLDSFGDAQKLPRDAKYVGATLVVSSACSSSAATRKRRWTICGSARA